MIAPIARPNDISTSDCRWMWPERRCRTPPGAFSAAAATNTAAKPTSEWNAATSCGSAVIWMRRATTVPTPPPATMATKISTKPPPDMPCCASVATMAIAMPIMPNMLPCRDVTGLERPRSARMNRTAATR